MGLEIMTDRYPPITSQTCYPLRQAALDGSYNPFTFANRAGAQKSVEGRLT